MKDWKKVHDFFIKYQDRLIYGTDLEENEPDNPESVTTNAHNLWIRDWKYFTRGDTLESPLVNGKFGGLHLTKNSIDKYYKNAQKWCLK